MNDDSFEELRRVLATRVRSDAVTPECLDDHVIAALADGSIDPSLRRAVLPHLASCVRCRTTVASVAGALADPTVGNAVAAADRGPWRLYRVAVPLAAAAVLLLLLRSPAADDGTGGGHRGGDGSDALAPVPVAPVGSVAAAPTLVWTSVAGADGYRVTLFDAAGHVAYEARAADTAATLPDSIILVAGRPYLWKVAARTGFDRWVTSRLVEFSVAARPPSPSP
jgi:hypothetical protein